MVVYTVGNWSIWEKLVKLVKPGFDRFYQILVKPGISDGTSMKTA